MPYGVEIIARSSNNRTDRAVFRYFSFLSRFASVEGTETGFNFFICIVDSLLLPRANPVDLAVFFPSRAWNVEFMKGASHCIYGSFPSPSGSRWALIILSEQSSLSASLFFRYQGSLRASKSELWWPRLSATQSICVKNKFDLRFRFLADVFSGSIEIWSESGWESVELDFVSIAICLKRFWGPCNGGKSHILHILLLCDEQNGQTDNIWQSVGLPCVEQDGSVLFNV